MSTKIETQRGVTFGFTCGPDRTIRVQVMNAAVIPSIGTPSFHTADVGSNLDRDEALAIADELYHRAGEVRDPASYRWATAILNALVSDEPDSKFNAEIVEWRRRVVATVKRNLAPSSIRELAEAAEVVKRVDCVCTEFADGSKFEMTSFAGGGSKGGAFSTVGCIETKPDGTTVHHRYTKADAGAREKLDAVINALYHAGAGSTSVIEDAGGDPVRAIAELERRLRLAGYYGDEARIAEFAEIERRIEEAEARAAGYAQRICNARRELDRTEPGPPHGDGG